jgi:hypothetical protein
MYRKKNNLKSIIFIWDEFTEYFNNNKNAITGFQTLCELSQTIPFHFIIVTHKSSGLFNEKDDSKKIIDRFIKPTCEINLPENMAFKLMARAMQVKSDPIAKKDWSCWLMIYTINLYAVKWLGLGKKKTD